MPVNGRRLGLLGWASLALAQQPTTSPTSSTANENNLTVDKYILGGTPASAGEFPFFVQGFGCGGSLVYEDVVLTAAHCDNPIWAGPVLVGGHELNQETGTGQWRDITTKLVRHAQWNDDVLMGHDLLMFGIQPPDSPAPITLNSNPNQPQTGDTLVAIGYGRTSETGPTSDVLLKVDTPFVDFDTCQARYGGVVIEEQHLCAGTTNIGTCFGDSGGPIVENNVLVGVTSGGVNCGDGYYPALYARVSGNLAWIQEQICALSANPPSSCNEPPVAPPTPVPTALLVSPTTAPASTSMAPTPTIGVPGGVAEAPTLSPALSTVPPAVPPATATPAPATIPTSVDSLTPNVAATSAPAAVPTTVASPSPNAAATPAPASLVPTLIASPAPDAEATPAPAASPTSPSTQQPAASPTSVASPSPAAAATPTPAQSDAPVATPSTSTRAPVTVPTPSTLSPALDGAGTDDETQLVGLAQACLQVTISKCSCALMKKGSQCFRDWARSRSCGLDNGGAAKVMNRFRQFCNGNESVLYGVDANEATKTDTTAKINQCLQKTKTRCGCQTRRIASGCFRRSAQGDECGLTRTGARTVMRRYRNYCRRQNTGDMGSRLGFGE